MRLGGWQRIGIVLSIVWALWAFFHERSAGINLAESMRTATFMACTSSSPSGNLDECHAKAREMEEASLDGNLENAGLAALVPIPLGWLLAWLAVKVGRWIRAGFSRPQAK